MITNTTRKRLPTTGKVKRVEYGRTSNEQKPPSRGELTLIRAARAFAALNKRKRVGDEELKSVAPMALRHRLRRDPLDEAGSGIRVERAMAEVFSS